MPASYDGGSRRPPSAARPSPYSFAVTAPPGTYTLVVHDTDESGGGKVNQDTKEVTVR